MLNERATGRTAGIPHPTLFVLDRSGVIRGKLGHEGYKERHGSADLLELVGALAGRGVIE